MSKIELYMKSKDNIQKNINHKKLYICIYMYVYVYIYIKHETPILWPPHAKS